MDFSGITRAHFEKIQKEMGASGKPEEIAGKEGQKFSRIIQDLVDDGYMIFDKNYVLAYPKELDVTENVASKLGVVPVPRPRVLGDRTQQPTDLPGAGN